MKKTQKKLKATLSLKQPPAFVNLPYRKLEDSFEFC